MNPPGGFNCYWPMPFRKPARITVENQRHEDIGGFFYQITYALTDVPDEAAYFHAQWRRGVTTPRRPEHVILDGVRGQGHYVGTYLAWTQISNGWWGEGEIKFFIDGDERVPHHLRHGHGGLLRRRLGLRRRRRTPRRSWAIRCCSASRARSPKHGLYRWHVMDPIRFEQDLQGDDPGPGLVAEREVTSR